MIAHAAGSECGISNDFVLVRKSRLELFDPAIAGLLCVSVLGAFFEGLLGLSQDLIHPAMNQTGLNPSSSARFETGSFPLRCLLTTAAFCSALK